MCASFLLKRFPRLPLTYGRREKKKKTFFFLSFLGLFNHGRHRGKIKRRFSFLYRATSLVYVIILRYVCSRHGATTLEPNTRTIVLSLPHKVLKARYLIACISFTSWPSFSCRMTLCYTIFYRIVSDHKSDRSHQADRLYVWKKINPSTNQKILLSSTAKGALPTPNKTNTPLVYLCTVLYVSEAPSEVESYFRNLPTNKQARAPTQGEEVHVYIMHRRITHQGGASGGVCLRLKQTLKTPNRAKSIVSDIVFATVNI